MLIKRYHSLDYIFSLEISEGIELISTAVLQDREEKLMFRWIAGGYEKTFSFAEFKDKLSCDTDATQTFSARSKDEILADVKNILD